VPVTTVLLVDRPDTLRRALRGYLTLAPDLQLVGDVSEAAEARTLVEQLRPDVVVLDAEMHDVDVPATARALRAASPTTAVVVHALNPDAFVDDGLTLVVGKHEGGEALLATVRAAALDLPRRALGASER